MNRRKIILILISIMIILPYARDVSGSSGTFYITDTTDDAFITQIGNYFGTTPNLPLRSATTDIISGLRFQSITIPQDARINNATLFVRTLFTFDPGVVSVTIYGVNENDAYAFNSSADFTRPYTSANVIWNVTTVNGNAWHNISVTEIVQEIVTRYGWESGNALAFIILGDSGTPRREFATIDQNVVYRPYLAITYDVTPESTDPQQNADPPYNDTDIWDWTWLNSPRGFDIWIAIDWGEIELLYTSSSSLDYHNSTTGAGGVVQWSAGGFDLQSAAAIEFIARLDPWIFLGGDNASYRIYYSDDEFSNNILRDDPNLNYPELNPYQGDHGSIIVDKEDNQTLHMVWTTPTPWQPGTYNVLYTNFTVLENGTLIWAEEYTNITNQGNVQYDPDIYCEMDGTLHVAWYGQQGTAEDQIWYRRRFDNGTWGAQVRVSEGDSVGSREPDVIANEETGEALIAWTYYDVTFDIRWDTVYPNNTDGTDQHISNAAYVSMVNERENNVAHLAYNSIGGNPSVDYRYKTIDNVSAWSAAEDVSPNGEKERYPTISLDEPNETLAVIWWDEWSTRTSFNYWQITDGPELTKSAFIATIQLRYPSSPDYHGRHLDDAVYFVSYPNGTLLDGPQDTEEDAEDLIDEFLGMDPEDPETEEYGTALTKNRWKMFVFVVGMVMFLGTPTVGIINRAGIGKWYLILFVSLCGLSLLWSLRYM